ncbi:ABC transporter permease [Pseudalkalibacillus sp. R45]|uniref:ABC transporter permease n=1 Tax=Pseudalkalibacillus sp. R45 TaxID=3457433 RepID=UPI003FCE5F9F
MVMTERGNGLASRTGMFGVNRLTRSFSNLLGSVTVILASLLPVSIYLLLGDGDFAQKGLLFIAYVVSCSGLGFLLANLLSNTLLYHLIAVALTVVTGVLGGSFLKLEEFSHRLANASQYTPQHWFLNGLTRSTTTTELIILLGLGVGSIILGLGIGAVRHDRA